MIYVTGDMHGDISRLRSRSARKLKKGDYLIVCGDFGFLWEGSKKERRILKWLGKRKYTVLFIEGTHDNLDLINEYPVSQWSGGSVHEISGKLKHLIRGSVFEIDGFKIFAFGGGESDDADLRKSCWWSEEMPTLAELSKARDKLLEHDNKLDYIFTHQSSRHMKRVITMHDNDTNVLDVFFDAVRDHCKYKQWFFGGYHINKKIPPSEMALFNAIVEVTKV
ncbi:MAG: metallophosphoesterase [Oscillospiraceae bacterium]|nr:metallophosphoesterase [Oscillospiraceae bacterium]